MIGRTLAHYEIVDLLGKGGMGEIYRAHDTHLDRDVALKVLPARHLSDPTSRRLFRKEALTLAKLGHPHIGAVFDFGSEGDTEFLVMELIPGTDLAACVKDGPLDEADVVRIGIQVADALEEAHEQRIVHLDLKPQNVMMTPKGQVKVLDFGLSKLLRSDEGATATMTEIRGVAGTLPYMAPEQFQDSVEVDARTDIYALGVTLYELASGQRPFLQPDATKLITAILQTEPRSLSEIQPDASTEFANVLRKCLAKNPRDRYQTAKELRDDLERCQAGATVLAPRTPARRRNRWAMAGAALLVLASLGLGIRNWWARGPQPSLTTALAVLPFTNLTGDPGQEYFVDGMTDALIGKLAGLGGLSVIGRESAMRFKDSDLALPEIAATLGVSTLVQASVMRDHDMVQVTAQVTEASTDRVLWANTFHQPVEDVFRLLNDVTTAIAAGVEVALSPDEASKLAESRSVDPRAYDAYLKGEHHRFKWTEADIRLAMEYYEAALEHDPEFAEAHVGMAECWKMLGDAGLEVMSRSEVIPNVKNHLLKALQFDPLLPEAHSAMGITAWSFDWDAVAAEKELVRAIELKPGLVWAHAWYSYLLRCQGRHDESLDQILIAKRLDPLHPFIDVYIAACHLAEDNLDESLAAIRDALERHPDYWVLHWFLGRNHHLRGEYEEAIVALEKARLLSQENRYVLGSIARTYSKAGRLDDAQQILDQLLALDPVPAGVVATVYAEMEDLEATFEWLERAYEQRNGMLLELNSSFFPTNVKSDPRHADLVRRVANAG